MMAMILVLSVLGMVIPSSLAYVTIYDLSTAQELAQYPSADSTFGRSLPEAGLTAVVFPADPLDGCSPIKPAPRNPLPHSVKGVVALIKRYGNCSFEAKVKAAEKANYSAVIVYNVNSESLIPMGGDGSDLIPSIFIGAAEGSTILKHYTYPKNPNVVFLLMSESGFDINTYLMPFAIIVLVCFVIMISIVIIRCIQEHARSRRHRLPKSALKKLPTIKFKDGDPYETCCICLDDFQAGDKLRILPCDHGYHIKCIDPWLVKNKRNCPQCRMRVFDDLGSNATDSEEEQEERENAPLLRSGRGRRTNGGTFGGSTSRTRRQNRDSDEPTFVRGEQEEPSGSSPGEGTSSGFRPSRAYMEYRAEQRREQILQQQRNEATVVEVQVEVPVYRAPRTSRRSRTSAGPRAEASVGQSSAPAELVAEVEPIPNVSDPEA